MTVVRTLLVFTLIASATALDAQPGAVRIFGAVTDPVSFTVADLSKMPRTKLTASAHDQTGEYQGVAVRELLTRAGVPAGDKLRGAVLATAIVVTGADGYRVVFGLAEFDPAFTDRVAVLADQRDGQPLPANARPFQLIVEGEKRPARWVRQVVSMEVVSMK